MLFLNILTRCERVHKMSNAAQYPIASVLGFRLVLSTLPKISKHFHHGKHGKHGKKSTTYQTQYLRKLMTGISYGFA